jgi:hypothetical protein
VGRSPDCLAARGLRPRLPLARSALFHSTSRPPAAPLCKPPGQAPIKITGQKGFATNQLFKSRTLSFESLGIGGLDNQFESIFRRAFASRVFPPSILERLGIHHVKVWPRRTSGGLRLGACRGA